jgi:hypothetical protein
MVACSDGVNVPLIELGIGQTISMNGCGYGKSKVMKNKNAGEVARAINNTIGRKR